MMKSFFVLFLMSSLLLQCQNEAFNTKKGYVAEGYDLVSYFLDKPVKGDEKNTLYLRGLKFKFSSQEHLKKFEANPEKYLPQYGGYCAYAIAEKGKKVSIDPETFEIRDGKLYLFYNSWGVNTLESWQEDNPDELKKEADRKWLKMSNTD